MEGARAPAPSAASSAATPKRDERVDRGLKRRRTARKQPVSAVEMQPVPVTRGEQLVTVRDRDDRSPSET